MKFKTQSVCNNCAKYRCKNKDLFNYVESRLDEVVRDVRNKKMTVECDIEISCPLFKEGVKGARM